MLGVGAGQDEVADEKSDLVGDNRVETLNASWREAR